MREGRLPCAAQSPSGSEDCAATNPKGWLPTGTLDPVASAPNTQGRLPVRYMVYRAPGTDLTSANTNEYVPSDAGGTPLADYPVVNSTLDTCRKLYLMASPVAPGATPPPAPLPMTTASTADTPTRWSMAYGLKGTTADTRQPYVRVGADVVNVAFGLAVPPAGASTASSGANAIGTSAEMEIPGRKPYANYRDQVLIEDAGALSRTLGCGPAQASVDLIAMAAGWSVAAAATRAGNIVTYGALVGIQSTVVISASLSSVEAGIELSEAYELRTKLEGLKDTWDVFFAIGETYEGAVQIANNYISLSQGALGVSLANFTMSTNAYLRYVINEGAPNYDAIGQLVYIGYGVVAAGLAFTSSLAAFDAVGRLGLALGAAADIKGEMEKNQSDLVLLDAGIRERAIQSANSTYFLEPSL